MPTIHLARTLRGLKTSSVRAMMQSTHTPGSSVFRHAQIAAINELYRLNDHFLGPFGFRFGGVRFDGNTASQEFSAGQIRYSLEKPEARRITVAEVRLVGVECVAESGWDQSSPADEPYFVVGVATAGAYKVARFGPLEGVDQGDRFALVSNLVHQGESFRPPILVSVTAVEHDHGSPAEAEAKVREAMQAIVQTFEAAAGAFDPSAIQGDVIPEWARKVLIGYVPKLVTDVLDLPDDYIGTAYRALFDREGDRAAAPAGQFQGNDYNYVLHIPDNDGEGSYNVYFKIDLVDKEEKGSYLEYA